MTNVSEKRELRKVKMYKGKEEKEAKGEQRKEMKGKTRQGPEEKQNSRTK